MTIETLVYLGFGLFLVFPVIAHLGRTRARERAARRAADRAGLAAAGPRAQHPHVDVSHCIGCGACVDACPEGDVLGVIAGKAAIVNGPRCIGHGLCAEACPVGAITIVMAPPGISADLPRLSSEYESSVPNVFVAGELGGLALIKNAVNQGRDCVDTIARRFAGRPRPAGVLDVCIVGAGPAGLSASLRAVERRLTYVTLEQEALGGTVAKYPRRKLVLTSPVDWPLHGRFNKLEISKERLMDFWASTIRKARLQVHERERVEDIRGEADGSFAVTTPTGRYRARSVILALGRRGTPRKLGVTGEDLPKVMYGLIEAEAYTDAAILVVGGGDSAVEAALGLSHQRGNRVTLSYRGEELSRIKERNAERLRDAVRAGRLQVLYRSNLREVRDRSVVVEVAEQPSELANDWVWIFAGGEAPNAFLEKIGVAVGDRDLTGEAEAEARLRRAG